MQGKDFLYFFTDNSNRSFYVENGLVKLSSVPRPLEFTPGEWQNIAIDNARNQKYFALDRSFSIPLNAVEDGAQILKDQFYNYGIEAVVNLVILKQDLFYDGTEFGYHYKSFYKGELDFCNFMHRGPVVTINVMEGGLPKLIKARENIVYELDMDAPDSTYIRWDGILLAQNAKYVNTAVTFYGNASYLHMLPVAFISKDGAGAGALNRSQGSVVDTSDYFIKATLPLTVHLKGSIKFQVTARVQGVILQLNKANNGRNVVNIIQYFDSSPTPDVLTTWNFDLQISLQPGDGLYFTGDAPGQLNSDKQIRYFETEISAKYSAAYTTTFVEKFTSLQVFEKLIRVATDGQYSAQSNLLSFRSDLSITCGDAIRGLPNSKLRTSISDFFLSINSQLDIGMGIVNGVVRLEEKAFFVDYSNPIQLGSVKGLKIKPDIEKFFTTLKVGGPNQSYNDVNGRQEFNTTTEFSSPITRITKELNLVSAYRIDGYGAEYLRINLEGMASTDNQGDNDVWIIHTEKKIDSYLTANNKPIYKLDRTLNQVSSGLLEPNSVFNLYLSPILSLKRIGSYIHSCFYKMDSNKLKFQTIDKNRDLAIQGLKINTDVNIGSLAPALYLPIILEFELAAPVDLIEALDLSPVRAFEFDYLGVSLKGIPIKAGIRPADNDVQTFTLLSAPDNNLTLFKDTFE
jgi:hypothetical protein